MYILDFCTTNEREHPPHPSSIGKERTETVRTPHSPTRASPHPTPPPNNTRALAPKLSVVCACRPTCRSATVLLSDVTCFWMSSLIRSNSSRHAEPSTCIGAVVTCPVAISLCSCGPPPRLCAVPARSASLALCAASDATTTASCVLLQARTQCATPDPLSSVLSQNGCVLPQKKKCAAHPLNNT